VARTPKVSTITKSATIWSYPSISQSNCFITPETTRSNTFNYTLKNNLNSSLFEINQPTTPTLTITTPSHPEKTKSSRNLTCYYTNATSINSRTKFDSLLTQLESLNYPDVICIYETWLYAIYINCE